MNALEVLTKGVDNKFNVCPWQEIRLVPHLHWQIDYILTDQEVRDFNRFEAGNDLLLMWYGVLDTERYYSKVFEYTKLHMAAQPQPLFKTFKITPPVPNVVYQPKALPRGWIYGVVDISTDYLVATQERGDGRHGVSIVQFCRTR